MKHEEKANAPAKGNTTAAAALARNAPAKAANATKQPAVQATKGPAPLSVHQQEAAQSTSK